MPPSDRLITVTRGGLDRRVTELVARVYYDDPRYRFEVPFPALLEAMLAEDAALAPYSTTYCVFEGDHLVGTCRRTASNDEVPLPIESEWGIDVAAVERRLGAGADAYELGRLAVRSADPAVMLTLLRRIDEDVHGDDLFLSCLDRTVLASFAKSGMPWRTLAPPRDYLGTPTIPAAARVADLRAPAFLRRPNPTRTT